MFTILLCALLQSAPELNPALRPPVPAPVPRGERIAATPLSTELPADIFRPAGSPSTDVVREFTIPADAIAGTTSGSFSGLSDMAGLSLSTVDGGRYYRSLVRSGTEDIRLCMPQTPCPVTVRFRYLQWWDPDRATVIQATFTSPTTYNEIVFLSHDYDERGWLRTSTGWRFLGVFTHTVHARPAGVRQDRMPPINEKARDTFRKLLACTEVIDRCMAY